MRRLPIIVLLLLLAGCTSSRMSPAPGQVVTDAQIAQVKAALAALPHVTEATLRFSHGPSVTGHAFADVHLVVSPGADPVALESEVTSLVWRSPLTPLDTIELGIFPPGSVEALRRTTVDVSGADHAALLSRLGPRPSP